MPLNLRHVNKFGFGSYFAILDFMSKSHDESTTILYHSFDTKSEDVSTSSDLMNLLNINRVRIQQNTNNQTVRFIDEAIKKLLKQGIISAKNVCIERCDCGKYENLQIASKIRTKNTLLDTESGLTICCHTVPLMVTEKAIMTTKVNLNFKIPEIVPNFINTEILDLIKSYSNRELLLSRRNARLYSCKIGKEIYFLDNDIMTYLHLYLHSKMNPGCQKVDCLISGISTVRQVLLTLYFSNMLGVEFPSKIYFLPRIDFKCENNHSLLLCDFFEKYKINPSHLKNTLCWCALTTSKSLSVDKTVFKRINENEILRVDLNRKIFIKLK